MGNSGRETLLCMALSALVGVAACQQTTASGVTASHEAVVESPDKLQSQYKKATEHLVKKDLKQVAADFRAVASEVEKGVNKGTSATVRRGKKLAGELRAAADEAEKGKVITENEVKQLFARAHYAMASQRFAGAKEKLKSDIKEAGLDLRASGASFEHALALTGQRASEKYQKALVDAREVSGRLISGTGRVTEDVGEAFTRYGKELQDFGQEVESANPSSEGVKPNP